MLGVTGNNGVEGRDVLFGGLIGESLLSPLASGCVLQNKFRLLTEKSEEVEGADWPDRDEGGYEVAEGADGTDVAAIYILSYG